MFIHVRKLNLVQIWSKFDISNGSICSCVIRNLNCVISIIENMYKRAKMNCIIESQRMSLKSFVRSFCSEISQGHGPLTGFRVLDLTRIVAGPYCTMILGDLGADVLKIERLKTGDESRKWGPPFMQNSNDSCYFMASNRNKRSVCVDLKSAAGKKIIYDLAKHSDVLVENYVPGKLDSMNLGYEDLKKVNSQLIYCSLTGYGSKGPYAKRPGYDVIAASLGGLLHMTGPKDGEPCKVGVAMTDIATGLYAHGAILAALLQRSRTKIGQKIDVNLLSTQVSTLINLGSNYLNANLEAQRWGTAHESIVPYESFPTKTGYLTIGAGSDEQFKYLCKILDVAHLSTDPKYINNSMRVKNRVELVKILRDILVTKTTADWLCVLEGAPFPYAPINNLAQVFNDEHIKAIGIVKEIPHKVYGSVKMVGPPVEYSASNISVRRPPPMLGEHTDEVLRELLDYNQKQLDELRLSHVIQ